MTTTPTTTDDLELLIENTDADPQEQELFRDWIEEVKEEMEEREGTVNS